MPTAYTPRNVTSEHATIAIEGDSISLIVHFDRAGRVVVENLDQVPAKLRGAAASMVKRATKLAEELFEKADDEILAAEEAAYQAEQKEKAEEAERQAAASSKVVKVAKAPRAAKVASADGFDTALAIASGIPNLAAWTQDGELLRSGGHVIRPSSSGFTWQHADGSSSSKSYVNVGTAVFYLQASRFPEWKRGSFESFWSLAA